MTIVVRYVTKKKNVATLVLANHIFARLTFPLSKFIFFTELIHQSCHHLNEIVGNFLQM